MARARYKIGELLETAVGFGAVEAIITRAKGYSYLLKDGTGQVAEVPEDEVQRSFRETSSRIAKRTRRKFRAQAEEQVST